MKSEFIHTLKSIDQSKNIYEIFHDFVFCSAAALRNSIGHRYQNLFNQNIENEYLQRINRYDVSGRLKIKNLFYLLVDLCEAKGEPYDVLGSIYMELEIGNDHIGQYFTPSEVSNLCAQVVITDLKKQLEEEGVISISDPACGAGSTLLSTVKLCLESKIQVQDHLYIEAADIDRNVALMCYIQLSLWAVPCRIFVGDTLKLKYRECWCSLMYYVKGWDIKLHSQKLKEIVHKTEDYVPNFILIND
nr:N-6 DNA methylase [Acinetobacter baumannii]